VTALLINRTKHKQVIATNSLGFQVSGHPTARDKHELSNYRRGLVPHRPPQITLKAGDTQAQSAALKRLVQKLKSNAKH